MRDCFTLPTIVLRLCNRLNMLWIGAERISTEMIEVQTIRDWADEQYVSGSVSNFLPTIHVEGAIPHAPSDSAIPDPTASIRIDQDLRYESLHRRHRVTRCAPR